MKQQTLIESMGTRIVSAARMAVAMHLQLSDRQEQSPDRLFEQKAMIGGTDRRVTDDLVGGNDER